eukprot:COSAG03_NODE_25557_length_265_cov_0.367470_1_plen_35_part_01
MSVRVDVGGRRIIKKFFLSSLFLSVSLFLSLCVCV